MESTTMEEETHEIRTPLRAGSVYAIHVVTVVKMFYKKHITFFVSLVVIITTQEVPCGTCSYVVASKSCSSFIVQQLGSGLYGLGIGALGIDWSTISSYLGSPLASPWFATANVAVGFVFVMYILTPLCYWLNVYKAKTFPIFSDDLFTSTGQEYNITAIIDSNFHLDLAAYEKEGPLYLSTFLQ
ncbi:hypothetical protein GH714_011296 [Hevea brasiliensis]|uniref:Uncharacterized protein n=1 Tax=Hevea brasiliensis TaxID=3981 RepID=A0A6A6MMU4_HEVBR|nr:hypothetical protein GH714_011296 [Hevea brasiliensis]